MARSARASLRVFKSAIREEMRFSEECWKGARLDQNVQWARLGFACGTASAFATGSALDSESATALLKNAN